MFNSLRKSRADLEAEELTTMSVRAGGQPLRDCAPGEHVCACGLVSSITIQPLGHAPTLAVELFDGTDVVNVVWLGRRRIAGIDPGRHIRVHGRLAQAGDKLTMFNPRYEILPRVDR